MTNQTGFAKVGGMLFVQGMMAALQRVLAQIPQSVRQRIISICGMVCLFTPLALWLSISIWGLQLILAVWLTAMIVLALMIWSSPDERI